MKSRIVGALVPSAQAFDTAERRGRQRHRRAGRRPTKRERASQTPLQQTLLDERLIEILDQIIGVFEADGQAQQTFG